MIRSKKTLLLLIVLISAPFWAFPQDKKLQVIKKDNTMDLKITPSATSSASDFDFLVGKWKVHNRRLNKIMVGSNDWTEFESELHMRKSLNGIGNVENYYATFGGKPFEGQAVRLFNPKTKLWTIYWMDSNWGMMDEHPVSGSFENGIGKMYAKDMFGDKEVIALYQWDATDPKNPKWSQALSADDGKTWEWNWEMSLTRIE